jgi:hypothetical protein
VFPLLPVVATPLSRWFASAPRSAARRGRRR